MGQPAAAQRVARLIEADAVRLSLGPSLRNLQAVSSMFSASAKTMECEMRWPW